MSGRKPTAWRYAPPSALAGIAAITARYTGESPDRYIWYRQHHRIDQLPDFIRKVREVTDEPQHVSLRQKFSSGRELIETVKARREQAQAFRAIVDETEAEMGEETDRYNPGSWCAGSTRDAPPATRQPFATR